MRASISSQVLYSATEARTVLSPPEAAQDRLDAVVAGPHGDPIRIECLADILRAKSVQDK